MNKPAEIVMLWVEGPLSYMEQLCAVSFRDAGHPVTLYHYGPVENVPDGIALADANDILRPESVITHRRTGSPAPLADKFRYHLLKQRAGVIWADTDAYCVRPFETATGYFFGWESDKHINNGVLGLPTDSPALAGLIQFTDDEYAIPDWLTGRQREPLEARAAAGDPVQVGDMPWGVWGPHAITHHLHKTGEAAHALPIHCLYPVSFKNRRKLCIQRTNRHGATTRDFVEGSMGPDTLSVHFYGRRSKHFLAKLGGLPQPDSYVDRLLHKRWIDPRGAPIPQARTEA